MKLRYVCAVLLFLLPRSVAGQLRVPAPVGYVNDFAGVIPQPQRDSIQRIIDEVRAKSGGEIVVVTLPRLEGQPVEDVALQIGRDWKIGQKGAPTDSARNTGTVLLIVPKESSDDGKGHLWIATGTGTSRFFTAAQAGLPLTSNVVNFDIISSTEIIMSFVANTVVPGVGTVTPRDIVKFTATSLGTTTAGSFSLYFKGSNVGLSASSEKIDAIGTLPGGDLQQPIAGVMTAPAGMASLATATVTISRRSRSSVAASTKARSLSTRRPLT